MRVYTVSDLHLGHRRIVEYSPARLPWAGATLADHDAAIIAAWRATVQPDDVVIFCGDFALGSLDSAKACAAQMTGKIDLILGNHDRTAKSMSTFGCFRSIQKRLDIVVPDVGRVIARHKPQDFTLEDAKMADVLLHGHIHGTGYDRPPRDERHAIPMNPWIRTKLVDASIEALPTAPAPMLLAELVRHARRTR